MSLFKIEADCPPYDQVFGLDGVLSVAATYTDDNTDRQSHAKEFLFSVNGLAKCTVECQRYDGKLAYVDLVFDGEQLKIDASGVR